MFSNIELFIPTLIPVVLRSKTAPVAASVPALADLDLAAFSGFAHEELSGAQWRLGEITRALTPAAEAVTSAKLAVLTAPYDSLDAGTIAYVVETDARQTAYLVHEALADAPSGYVRLPRSFISLTPPVQAQKTTGDKTADDLLKLANMAAAKLPPGPVGTAVNAVLGLVSFFSSEGPSEAQIIIDAIKSAIDAAVVELESFMVEQQLNTIETVIIGDAYDWLKAAEVMARGKKTVRDQILFARTAVVEMKEHIGRLRPWCKMLTRVSMPDPRGSMRAGTKALKLLACGAGAMCTMIKLRLQFNAFLAMNETTADRREESNAAMQDDRVAFKLAVLGDDRELPSDPDVVPVRDLTTLGPGSLILAYSLMWTNLVRDRASSMIVQPPARGPVGMMWGKLVDPWGKIDQDLNLQDWKNFQASVGLSEDIATFFDRNAIEHQKKRFIQAVVMRFAEQEGFHDTFNSLKRYIELVRDWDKEVVKWNALPVRTATETAH